MEVARGHAVHGDDRRADALDLRAHADQEVAQVDDLGLAGRVVERRRPLGQRGRHDDVLGRTDARELERDVGAPQPVVGDGVEVVVVDGEPGAERLEAGHVEVDRPGAEVVAARQGEPGAAAAGQQRTEHRRRGPHPRGPGSVGATGSTVGGLRQPQHPGARRAVALRAHADRVEQLAHELDVDDPGHVRELVGALREDARRHQLEHGVLGAAHRHRAGQRAGRPHGDRTHPVSMLARCPGWRRAGRARRRTRRPVPTPPTTWSWRPRTDPVGSSRRRVRSSATSATVQADGGRLDHRDHRATGSPSRGSAGCSRCPTRRSLQRAPSHRPHGGRSRGGRRRSASTPGPAHVLGLLAAAQLTTGFCNTLFSQTVAFAADEFGASEGGAGRGRLRRAGRHHLHASLLLALADRIGRRRILVGCGRRGAAPRRGRARSRRPSRSSPPSRRSPDRSPSRSALVVDDRGRRGDAAGEPRLRGERARPGLRPRRRHVRLGAPAGRPRRPHGWRLVYAVGARVPRRRRRACAAACRRAGATSCPTPSGRRCPGAASSCWRRRRSSTTCSSPPTTFYENRYLKDVRGYSATLIALFTIVTATPGAIGVMAGGRLADVKGRRAGRDDRADRRGHRQRHRRSRSPAPALWGAKLVTAILAGMAVPALGVYAAELFPTVAARRCQRRHLRRCRWSARSSACCWPGSLLDQGVDLRPRHGRARRRPLIYAALVVVRLPRDGAARARRHQPRGPHQGRPQLRGRRLSAAAVRTARGRTARPPRARRCDGRRPSGRGGRRRSTRGSPGRGSSPSPRELVGRAERVPGALDEQARHGRARGGARCAACPAGPAGAAGRRSSTRAAAGQPLGDRHRAHAPAHRPAAEREPVRARTPARSTSAAAAARGPRRAAPAGGPAPCGRPCR